MAPTQVTSKLLSWADDLDQGTINQAAETAKLPIIAGHMALMPDAHLGFGCAIGAGMSGPQWAGSVFAGMLVMVAFPDIGVWRRVALIAAIAIIALVASEATS